MGTSEKDPWENFAPLNAATRHLQPALKISSNVITLAHFSSWDCLFELKSLKIAIAGGKTRALSPLSHLSSS